MPQPPAREARRRHGALRSKTHGQTFRQGQGKDPFAVVRDVRCVTMAPGRVQAEGVFDVPVLQGCGRKVQPGFLAYFAPGGGAGAFAVFPATGDRLPETRVAGAFQGSTSPARVWMTTRTERGCL